MAFVEVRVVRKFRFETTRETAEQLMRIYTEPNGYPSFDPKFDAAFNKAASAFDQWRNSEYAASPFFFDETADCVLGADVLHGFEIVPESALDDGTPTIYHDGSII